MASATNSSFKRAPGSTGMLLLAGALIIAGWWLLAWSPPVIAAPAWRLLLAGILTALLIAWFRKAYRRIPDDLWYELDTIAGQLRAFDMDAPHQIRLAAPHGSRLADLTADLQALLDRILEHYLAGKQFTENASHELQTPLAIIKAQAELLLQSSALPEEDMEALGVILQNVNRLSKLNSALILLSKIEHHQFADYETVSIPSLVRETLDHFADMIEIRKLQVTLEMPDDLRVRMSGTLAEIMLGNLIQNAIRHNISGGSIHIRLAGRSLSIRNPGLPPEVPPSALFDRFTRSRRSGEGLGLGLAIVDRICKLNDFGIDYAYADEQHVLTVHFLKASYTR